MLLYATCATALFAISRITAETLDASPSQDNPENDPQHLYYRPNIPKEPAPVYEHEVLSIKQHAPVASHTPYIPILTNQEPSVKVASLTNYAPLASQQTVLVHQGLAPTPHLATPLHNAGAQPIAQQQDYDGLAHYEFSYSVDDDHTGDHKSQHETRHGDVVTGEYQLQQPDGSVRKVEYSADGHSGFNAIVHNLEPSNHHVVAQHNQF